MLENIRENSQGMVAKIVLGFIILTFAVAGIGSYSNSVDTSVAEVNGEKISQQDFEKAYQGQRNRMSQQFGEMFESLSSNEQYMTTLRNNVLDSLINEKLLDQNAEQLAIRVSDEYIKTTIRTMPEFQIDGVFDNNRYIALINQAGFYQPSNFRDYLRLEMVRRQLSQGVVTSEFSLPYQAKIISALNEQKRDFRFATIKTEQFKTQVDVSEEEVNDYYQQNITSYQNAEKVKVDYLVLDAADITKTIEISDADAKAYYQDNVAKYTTPAKRRLSHILIESSDTAKQDAADILVKAQSGEDFIQLAKTYSTDTFSAENGGDLDWLEMGVMGTEFENAAVALSTIGQLSGLVETEFGVHILKLTDFKAESVQSYDDVKTEVLTLAAEDQAQTRFFELLEELKRVSYEFPDSLDDAADIISAPIQTSPWLTRGGNQAPFNQAKVIETLFSEMVLTENLNSDVIEVSDNVSVVVHLNEYQAATAKAFDEVSESIKTLLVSQKANEKALVIVDEVLTQFTSGEDITAKLVDLNSTFEDKVNVARSDATIDSNILRQAFSLAAPEEGQVSASSVNLNNGDMVLLQVQAVNTPTDVTVEPQLEEQLSQALAQSAYLSYVNGLSATATISRKNLVVSRSE
jgi:peptidyl-prolyl cis-trans isomerase D